MGFGSIILFIIPAVCGAGFRMVVGRPRFRILAPFSGLMLIVTPALFLVMKFGLPPVISVDVVLAFLNIIIVWGLFFAIFFFLGDLLAKPFREMWVEQHGAPKEVQSFKDTF